MRVWKSNPVYINKMKITKSKLLQIIEEEIEELLTKFDEENDIESNISNIKSDSEDLSQTAGDSTELDNAVSDPDILKNIKPFKTHSLK